MEHPNRPPAASRHTPARVTKGEWRNGPQSSVRQLQQEHHVGRDTVLRAVEPLRDEGLVFTTPPRHLFRTRHEAEAASHALWGPSGDHTVYMRPNNPQVATLHVWQAERL